MSPRHFLHDAARPPLSSQVEAAEAARESCSGQLQRLLRPDESGVPMADSWENLREQRIIALERGLAARDAEATALRNAGDQARVHAARLTQSISEEQAQTAATIDRLQSEILAAQVSLPSRAFLPPQRSRAAARSPGGYHVTVM